MILGGISCQQNLILIIRILFNRSKVVVAVSDSNSGLKDSNGKVLARKYGTIEQDGSIYMVRYNSDATVKELVKVGEVAAEEGENETNN